MSSSSLHSPSLPFVVNSVDATSPDSAVRARIACTIRLMVDSPPSRNEVDGTWHAWWTDFVAEMKNYDLNHLDENGRPRRRPSQLNDWTLQAVNRLADNYRPSWDPWVRPGLNAYLPPRAVADPDTDEDEESNDDDDDDGDDGGGHDEAPIEISSSSAPSVPSATPTESRPSTPSQASQSSRKRPQDTRSPGAPEAAAASRASKRKPKPVT
ncbi:hypothetical protein M378DRAFT_16653, partial [Amanita muscaria Koide BX008]